MKVCSLRGRLFSDDLPDPLPFADLMALDKDPAASHLQDLSLAPVGIGRISALDQGDLVRILVVSLRCGHDRRGREQE
jgi:hypothetical protein